MKNSHIKRISSALLAIPVLMILIFYGNLFLLWLASALCILLGLLEFYQLLAQKNIYCQKYLGIGLGLLVSIGFWKANTHEISSLIIFMVIILPFLISLFQTEDLSTVFPKLFGTIIGVFYVAWLFSHLIWIRQFHQGKIILFYLLVIVWAGDIGAFYAGTHFGKHKLSRHISPKKSIEGSIGGVLSSIIVSIIAHFTFLKQLSLANALILGFFLNILAQLGDLAESMLKRGAGVKDSGTLIPGHGGILDRIDSILFAGPALYYYAVVYLPKL